jgi:hypothetical protein
LRFQEQNQVKTIGNCHIGIVAVALFCTFLISLQAQVRVTSYHNDNSQSGQNTQETILTPANVNSNQFGKLFSVSVNGYVYAQPLYLSNVNIGSGTHNVLYVATEHDSLYAIDADTGKVYWQVSLIPSGGSTVNSGSDLACGDLVPEVGITGTPVIDTSTGTIYLVAKSKVNGSLIQYLHAIDVATSVEKFGGPMLIQATVPGTASDGNGTTVNFSPHFENQRAGLLLVNGHVVIGWGSHCDISPWHGWIMAYSASTLAQEAAFNTSADGRGNGIWMAGGGLATDSNGNIFFATGNGTWNGTTDYGDSIVKLGPPSGGSFPVLDYFTPYNQSSLAGGDSDLGSGGLVLLPALPSGRQLLTQMGKEGTMFVIDINKMGQYCVNEVPPCQGRDSNIVQEIPGATAGVWGTPAYWNGSVYWAGGTSGVPDNLKAFSFNSNDSGLISTSPTSESSQTFSFPAPSLSISANGNVNGILWGLDNSGFGSTCSSGSASCQVLYAYDATNLANMLYNSSQAPNNRDIPGAAVKFATPTIANGKVYVGSQLRVSAYGMISTTPTAATPTFNTAPGSYTGTITVTLSDSTSSATIYCTTDGSTPTASSPRCGSVAINSTTILKAMATASGFNPSAIASGNFTIDPGATGIIYGSGFTSTGLTFNGSAKLNGARLRLTDTGKNEAGSAFISAPIGVQTFTTDFSFQLSDASAEGFTFAIQGVGATALGPSGGGLGYGANKPGGTPGIANSVAVKFDIHGEAGEGTDSTGLYIDGASPTTPALKMTSSGVALLGGDVFNVHMTYDGTTLTMTITDATNFSQTFTSSWAINIPGTVGSNTAYVGFTGSTGGLTAIQEILDWTYVTSQSTVAMPTFSPAPGSYNSAQSVTLSDMTAGAKIYCTTDGTTPTASSPACTTLSVSTTTTVEAMAVANGYNNSAAASGTYTINTNDVNYASGFSSTDLALNGSAVLNGTKLRLTNGGKDEAGSGFYTLPLSVQSFTTNFSFQLTNPNADGIAFVIQNVGTTALGPMGDGLGYGGTGGIPSSVAVKFDFFNNSGEGPNSTGLYKNGASPTIPATTLGGQVNLHSGDVFNVHITYDGTTLTMTITDSNSPADTFMTSWAVNIPGTVGAPSAYAGFTGGTGGETATQDILTWTFTPGAPQ